MTPDPDVEIVAQQIWELEELPRTMRSARLTATRILSALREKHQANNALISAGYRIAELTAQRDALQQVIDRLTSEQVLERAAYAVAMNSVYDGYNAETREMEWLRNRGIYRGYARTAITAALAAASAHNEGCGK